VGGWIHPTERVLKAERGARTSGNIIQRELLDVGENEKKKLLDFKNRRVGRRGELGQCLRE